MTDRAELVDLATVRQFLLAAFNAEELSPEELECYQERGTD